MTDSSVLQSISREELFPYLPGRDLLKLCQTNRAFAKACRDDRVWRNKVITEYSYADINKKATETWRQYYIRLINSPTITFYHHGFVKDIPSILVTKRFISNAFTHDLDFAVILQGNTLVDLFFTSEENIDLDDEVTHVLIISQGDPSKFCIRKATTSPRTICDTMGASLLRLYLYKHGIDDQIYGQPRIRDLDNKSMCRLLFALDTVGLIKVTC